MEEGKVQSMSFQSKRNPKVKVTLEFTGEVENSAVEEEITGVLMEKYLEKVFTKACIKRDLGITLPDRKEGGRTL